MDISNEIAESGNEEKSVEVELVVALKNNPPEITGNEMCFFNSFSRNRLNTENSSTVKSLSESIAL